MAEKRMLVVTSDLDHAIAIEGDGPVEAVTPNVPLLGRRFDRLLVLDSALMDSDWFRLEVRPRVAPGGEVVCV